MQSESLRACLDRIKNEIDAEADILYIKENGRYIALEQKRIISIESKDHYLDIATDSECYHIYGKISDYQSKLGDTFVRCHKGFIIELNHVQRFGSNSILMKDGRSLPIGRKYNEEVKQKFLEFLEGKL